MHMGSICFITYCNYLHISVTFQSSGQFYKSTESNLVKLPWWSQKWLIHIHSFIPLACAEYDDSLSFSGASSIPVCYIPFPSILFHNLVFHPPSLHFAIYFLVCLSALLFANSYIIHFYEFCCLPFSAHAQTSVIHLTLSSLSQWVF